MKRRRNKPGRISAWLVTWEWIGNHAKRKDKIAAVLNWRLTRERVAEIIEMIYANEYYTLEERVAFAKDRKLNPYQAQYAAGRISCGHNPFLEARLVDNVYVTKDFEGCEQLMWQDRKRPDMSWIHNKTNKNSEHNTRLDSDAE